MKDIDVFIEPIINELTKLWVGIIVGAYVHAPCLHLWPFMHFTSVHLLLALALSCKEVNKLT